MIADIWTPVGAFVLSTIGVAIVLAYARRSGLVDIPNHRSSHTVPTPRGGGLALVFATIVAASFEATASLDISDSAAVAVVLAVAALTIVGWLDDRRSLPVSLRLFVHSAAALAIAMLVRDVAPVPWPMAVLWLFGWAIWTMGSINITNFMDGIDGLVATQGVVYGVFLFALLPPDVFAARFGLIMAAACAGFLVWNWPPAKIFMGDVGSGPLGFFFVLGGAMAHAGARATLVFLPLFPVFFDALVTLIRRFRRGESLTAAHKSHLYQRVANGGAGHSVVTMSYALAAAFGAVLAVYLADVSVPLSWFAIGLYCAAVAAVWKVFDRRYPYQATPEKVSPSPSASEA